MKRPPKRLEALVLVAVLTLGGLAFPPALATADSPNLASPNVLFLVADDLGFADVGFNNADSFYETPNIDRIAAEGMRFTQAYAACPVCSPTRVSIQTGGYPARFATTDYFGAPQPQSILEAGRKGRNGRFQKLPLLPAPYVNQLPAETTTIAEALNATGYATFFAGKWHLGGKGSSPLEHGYDVNIGGDHRGGPYGRGRYFHPFDLPNLESEPGDHLPARLAAETTAFIRAHRERPWFAMLSFYSVHTPLLGREDLVAKYEQKRTQLDQPTRWGQEGARKNRLTQDHAVYAAMIEAMDEAVGSVLSELDRLDLADNTLVLFFSDNGGLSTSEGHPTSNLPLRAGKGWLYEGGIREPCALRWPGEIPQGTTSDRPIISCDFMPTILAATGSRSATKIETDGVDLTPLLRDPGAPQEQRSLFWHYPHWGNQGGTPGGAIQRGDWKLIEFFLDERSPELYNLRYDPGESNDLARLEPERATALLGELRQWRQRIDARMPTANPLVSHAER